MQSLVCIKIILHHFGTYSYIWCKGFRLVPPTCVTATACELMNGIWGRISQPMTFTSGQVQHPRIAWNLNFSHWKIRFTADVSLWLIFYTSLLLWASQRQTSHLGAPCTGLVLDPFRLWLSMTPKWMLLLLSAHRESRYFGREEDCSH